MASSLTVILIENGFLLGLDVFFKSASLLTTVFSFLPGGLTYFKGIFSFSTSSPEELYEDNV